MKVCFKCAQAKPLSEFYRHPKMGDGYLGKCKDCTKKDTKDNRMARIQQYRAYDKQRASLPHRRALAHRVQKDWRNRYPYRKYAQSALRSALIAGRVKPTLCVICGEKAEAHHPDYSAPLDVVWLCSAHHKQAHALARKAA